MQSREIEGQIVFERCDWESDHARQFVAQRVWLHACYLSQINSRAERGGSSILGWPTCVPSQKSVIRVRGAT